MELLHGGDIQGIETLIAQRPSAMRHILGRLWDEDPELRHNAALAIGRAAAQNPDLCLELLRRFAWALNDESATHGVAVIPALGAIAVEAPEIARPFIGQIVGALDDPGLRSSALGALKFISKRRPELLKAYQGSSCFDEDELSRVTEPEASENQKHRSHTWKSN